MENLRDRKATPTRIGELLVAAKIIRPQILLEALQIAKKSTTPIGRVLMSIGELTERDLENAIEIQSLIRKNLISSQFGIHALNLSSKARVPLAEAFQRLGWSQPQNEIVNTGGELGELLIEASIVQKQLLDEAHYRSKENHLPLGRCLVLGRAITSALLNSALTAQALIRDGVITREQAVAGLKSAAAKQQNLDVSLQQAGISGSNPTGVRIGELLTTGGIITDSDRITAVEAGLVTGRPVGEILVTAGIISQHILNEALKLQNHVASGTLSVTQAADVLKQVSSANVSIQPFVEEIVANKALTEESVLVIGLLQQAQIIAPLDLQNAAAIGKSRGVSAVSVLFDNKLLNQQLVRNAFQAKKMIDENVLHPDHAVKVLQHSCKTSIDFADALKEVQWTASTNDQSSSGRYEGSWFGKLFDKNKRQL